jgi:hypothetical protein
VKEGAVRDLAEKREQRWALVVRFSWGRKLLGRYCWGATNNDRMIRTFRTRALARAAKRQCCYENIAEVVKVEVVVRELPQ